MAHENTRDDLITIANNNNGDPLGFLEAFSPIHSNWHGPARTYGRRLTTAVRYEDNGVNLQATSLPVPEPAEAVADVEP